MNRTKYVVSSVALIVVFALLGYFLVREQRPNAKYPFRFGLDLVGGTELVYKADVSKVDNVGDAMSSLKDVIERRVNIFGVSEPLVQTEDAGIVSGNKDERLIVELPGITDLDQAIALIGQTPILEFRLAKASSSDIIKANPAATIDDLFIPTGLTGRYLAHATVEFDSNTQAPLVGLEFNNEGSKLFAEITRDHKGEILAIILDNSVLSAPVIQDEITSGKAQINGRFSADEVKTLVRNLNYGALPVPITLSTSETIGASLGAAALHSGVRAGLIGLLALAIFLILWYRLPGLVASVALISYIILSLVVFAFIPVTLTAAGLAGFILSIGMAVDANVLIFERTKEELKKGRTIRDALHEGFSRAWLSIRDSNISSIITAIVLFWIGTSAVKGFALTLGLGVVISMFTAITVSRTFLFAIAPEPKTTKEGAFKRFLFSNGFHIK
ncbi:MAG: protein-export rane protein SecD, preprotein translocase subunit SecD [Parcubacteria group bacterium]|nr:protein-export rane protein SecD, preprotein translocase subunit SecD [Parcubacteria group bacterium]